MKNTELSELNFNNLLLYGRQPEGRGKFSSAIQCKGFCVSCEKKGFLNASDHRLDQMSHGADTDDFEQAICPLPADGIKISVAFLLESPGGDYGNGSQIPFEGITKRPPVNHYYWTPEKLTEWPYDPSNSDPKSYGAYFAYLLGSHKLHNAYFTNIIKCSLVPNDEKKKFIEYYVIRDPNNRDSKIRKNCSELFLRREMELVKPEIVFFFGKKAARMGSFEGLKSLLPAARFVTLYHPAARASRSKIVKKNDKLIAESLRDVLRNR